MRILLTAVAALALVACAAQPTVTKVQTVTVTTPVYVPLDPTLTQEVPTPTFPARTPLLNRDLVDYLVKMREALQQANAQLQTIRSLQPPPAQGDAHGH